MKRKRVAAPTMSSDQTSMFACRVAACHADLLEQTERQLHDDLVAANHVRLGPVIWTRYDTTDKAAVREILERTGHHPATDLLTWITLHPGVTLVVAMVEVPAPPGEGIVQ